MAQLAEIFDKLDKSGYKGYLSLEPHLANFAGLANLGKKMRQFDYRKMIKRSVCLHTEREELLQKKNK